jgi:hypothetical protein
MDNIQLAGFSKHRLDRNVVSGKTRGGGLFLFVNNSWCTKSNNKEVSRFCSPEVEYLMISCRPLYLPRVFSNIFYVAVYLPPQTDGTKTTLNELYKAINKQENAHPEALLLVAWGLMQGNLNLFYLIFTSMLYVQQDGKKTLDHLYFTHREASKLSLALHLTNLTIILSS